MQVVELFILSLVYKENDTSQNEKQAALKFNLTKIS